MYMDLAENKTITLRELKIRHKNVSFPASGPTDEWLSANMYSQVKVAIPVAPQGKILVDAGIEKVGNEYRKKYDFADAPVREPSEIEVRLAAIEAKISVTAEDKEAARAALIETRR